MCCCDAGRHRRRRPDRLRGVLRYRHEELIGFASTMHTQCHALSWHRGRFDFGRSDIRKVEAARPQNRFLLPVLYTYGPGPRSRIKHHQQHRVPSGLKFAHGGPCPNRMPDAPRTPVRASGVSHPPPPRKTHGARRQQSRGPRRGVRPSVLRFRFDPYCCPFAL